MDIKTENILINSGLKVKLIDFAFSKHHLPDERIRIFCGSLNYMAPEILNKEPYLPKKADIYSLGVVIHKLVVGKLPFKAADCAGLYAKITENQLSDLEAAPLTLDLKKLIASMLERNPTSRPSVDQLLDHAWIKRSTK